MTDLLTHLRKYNLFQDLPESDLRGLAENSKWKTFKKNETIFEKGGAALAVYIVGFGAVKLVQFLSNGDEVIIHLIPPGELFAGMIVMRGKEAKYPLTAVALEDSGTIEVNSNYFRVLVSSKGALGTRLIQMVSQRMLDHHSEKSVSRGTVAQRIAEFLLRTLENQPKEMGHQIMLRLTRQDIANATGTSVETVIRILSQWTQDRLILTKSQHIEILQINMLKQILEND